MESKSFEKPFNKKKSNMFDGIEYVVGPVLNCAPQQALAKRVMPDLQRVEVLRLRHRSVWAPQPKKCNDRSRTVKTMKIKDMTSDVSIEHCNGLWFESCVFPSLSSIALKARTAHSKGLYRPTIPHPVRDVERISATLKMRKSLATAFPNGSLLKISTVT